MSIEIIMPRQGQSVETCIITKWFRGKGEQVKSGDLLFSYETDKAAFDMESPADGTILEIFFNEGSEVPVLTRIAVLGDPGEAAIAPDQVRTLEAEPVMHSTEPASKSDVILSGAPDTSVTAGIRISPRARRLANANNLNYNGLTGSGPNGRIVCSDIGKVLASAAGAPAPKLESLPEYSDAPVSNIRKLIAGAMHSSLSNSAQLTHHMSADARKIIAARKRIKEAPARTSGTDITLNDMICWCVIRALRKFPEANSHFLDDHIRTFNKVHLGIAVDTPRGLMVPVVRDAGEMDPAALSVSIRSVAGECRKGSINPELLRSAAASFTVSNLGNYGVEMFTPVINLPQVAILGVCTITYRPADLGNNVFGFVPVVGLSLTYDHRAIDGGPATLFLREIKDQIESFEYQS